MIRMRSSIGIAGLFVAVSILGPRPVLGDVSEATWPADLNEESLHNGGYLKSGSYKSYIATAFRPIFCLNSTRAYPPAALSRYLQGVKIEMPKGSFSPTNLTNLVNWVKTNATTKCGLKSNFDAEHSNPIAQAQPAEIFHRELVFDQNHTPFMMSAGREYLTVQYFCFDYFNDADFPADGGDHAGDWMCLDITLIVAPGKNDKDAAKASYKHPIVHSAILHNHGRQFYVDSLHNKQLTFDGSRPKVFMEGGSGELWPTSGDRGFESWPISPGFLGNKRFQKCQGIWSPEQECHIVRQHLGNVELRDYKLVSLDAPSTADAELVDFVKSFRGKYGTYHGPFAECPEGPPFNGKMWSRDFDGANRKFTKWLGHDRSSDTPAVVKRAYLPRE